MAADERALLAERLLAKGFSRPEALRLVAEEARKCRACRLWQGNTQTVFGAGSPEARVMLIGEAPGQQEDLKGAPFVGAAGRLLDEALAAARLSRQRLWTTNIVKHRPWVEVAGRRRNRAPKRDEIDACRPWLDQEIQLIQPKIIACLGALAAREVLGKGFRLTVQRGRWFSSTLAPHVLATVHPAYVLIQPAETYEEVRRTFFEDLARVAEKARALDLV